MQAIDCYTMDHTPGKQYITKKTLGGMPKDIRRISDGPPGFSFTSRGSSLAHRLGAVWMPHQNGLRMDA
jgi:hypothetical protein